MALTVACLPLAVGAVSGAQEPLRFNKDGKFKILVATDIHEDEKDDAKSADAMALLTNAIEELKPDLVVFNGDNATADGLENQRDYHSKNCSSCSCEKYSARRCIWQPRFGIQRRFQGRTG